MTFKYGSKVVGTATLVTINGLTYASLPLPPLGPATYTFTAVYNGDSGDLPSSASTTFTVSAAPAGGAAVALAIPGPSRAVAATPALDPAPTVLPPRISARAGNRIVQGQPERAWLDALDSLDAER